VKHKSQRSLLPDAWKFGNLRYGILDKLRRKLHAA